MKRKLFGVLIVALSLTACGDYGSGEKIGMITKLNQQGTICQTWEGEIIRGGMNAGSGSFGAPFQFTIEDPVIVGQIKDALEKQYEVKITYHIERASFCRSDSADHFLTSVLVMNAPKLEKHKIPTESFSEETLRTLIREELKKLFLKDTQ